MILAYRSQTADTIILPNSNYNVDKVIHLIFTTIFGIITGSLSTNYSSTRSSIWWYIMLCDDKFYS